jgi:DNA-binding transcriptional LysR family regulator
MLRRQISSPNALFTFETVARLGSFSAAAKELNVTQPAVSHAINSLEAHLKYPLFKRHGRWIELTQNGNKLFRATSTAFKIVGESLREIDQRQDNYETVSISMSPVAVNYWFLPRMKTFLKKFPLVSLSFREYSKDSEQLLRDADLNIRLSNPHDADMYRWPYADERIMALCSPQYLAANGPLDKYKEQAEHTFLEWRSQRYGLDEFLHATGLHLPERSSFIKFSDYSSVHQSALLGQGIAIAWVSEASLEIISGKLVPACSQVVKTGRRYHILASSLNPMRPIVEDIRDWLIAEMRNDEKSVTSTLKSSWNLF